MADPVLSLFDLLSGAAAGTIDVALYSATIAGSGTPQLSDFTEATFTGYEREPIPNPGMGTLQSDGSYLLSSPQFTFQVGLGTPVPGSTVRGAYAIMTVGGQSAVAGFVQFATPVDMLKVGQYVQFSMVFSADTETLS